MVSGGVILGVLILLTVGCGDSVVKEGVVFAMVLLWCYAKDVMHQGQISKQNFALL